MRTVILHISIFLLLITAFPAFTQVTITESTFPRLASFTDSAQVVLNANIPIPTAGEDQVWDYGFLDRGITGVDVYFDATSDPNFPDALNYTESDFNVSIGNFSFPIESDLYESIDSEGWYRTGRSFNSTFSIPLTAFTGGANDRIDYAPASGDYIGRYNLIQFPLNYSDRWLSNYYFDLPYTVTAPAFGLNQVPASTRATRTIEREVIGWGSLIIPQADGTPSGEIDALLVRGEYISIDSVYLNGSPAPEALLNILGITQGIVVETDTFYIFYTPGFAGPVLILEDINTDGTLFEKAVYRTQAAPLGTATKEASIPTVQTFPNPVAAGSNVTLTIEDGVSSGQVHLYDLHGRLLHSIPFVASTDDAMQIKIPDTLNAGLLMLQITDEDSLPIGVGKLKIY